VTDNISNKDYDFMKLAIKSHWQGDAVFSLIKPYKGYVEASSTVTNEISIRDGKMLHHRGPKT
jgi:hypothetical protein